MSKWLGAHDVDHTKIRWPMLLLYVRPIENMVNPQESSFIPHKTNILRKPEPEGIEIRTIADVGSGIIFGLKIQEGASGNKKRPNPYYYSAEYGKSHGTARY